MNKVFVEYDGGINTALEDQINKAASYDFRGNSDVRCDSGCLMIAPYTRDLAFYYESPKMAAEAAEKLRELSDVRVKTELSN